MTHHSATTRLLKPAGGTSVAELTLSSAPRRWARLSESFLGVACTLACPPTRSFACWLAMGGGPILGGRGDARSGLPRRETWSSLRGRDPAELEHQLSTTFARLFAGQPPAIELVESRFRALTHPGLPGLTSALRRRRVRELQEDQAAARFTPLSGTKEPDHLAVELHFLAHLLDGAVRHSQDGTTHLQRAAHVAQDHVISWLPSMRAALRARGEQGFFFACMVVAEAAAHAVVEEAAALDSRTAPRGRR